MLYLIQANDRLASPPLVHLDFRLLIPVRRLGQGCGQGLLMDLAGQMDRAFAINGIPAGRIRAAIILDIKADAHQGVCQRQIQDAGGGLPGGPAGSPFQDFDVGYPTVGQCNPESRFAEFFSILTQADLPGKGASGRGRMDPLTLELFARSNQGDVLSATQIRQVVAQIRVP